MAVEMSTPHALGLGGLERTAETIAMSLESERAVARDRAGDAATQSATPDEAMRSAEIARTRSLVPVALGLAITNALGLQLLGGDATAKAWVFAGIAAATSALLYLLWLTSRRALFTERRVGAAFAVCLVALYTSVYYWGLFSPASNGVVVGIFFVAIGRSAALARLLFATAVCAHCLLSVLVVGGLIPDHGMLTAAGLPPRDQIIAQLLVLSTFGVAFYLARTSRDQLERAVCELDEAARAVAQREALLHEARAELDRALQIGGPGRFSDQRLGSFRLGAVIGRGATAEVYDAVHVETGGEAAVKVLRLSSLGANQLTRLAREAQAAAAVESPHLVRLFEVGGAAAPLPYLAMERLRGADLAQRLRESNRLPPAEVGEMVEQIAHGLDAAHAAGVVHRDINPQNLFRHEGSAGPVWKLLDFGVSKLADHDGSLTRGGVVGTPVYMAPEQAQGKAVGCRADIYGLAAVAYRALTGRPPFSGGDLPGILYNVVFSMPPRPSALCAVSEDVDRVLAIGLAKHPDERFATASELALALGDALALRLAPELRHRADVQQARKRWSRT